MGLEDLTPKMQNQVEISLEAWCIKNLREAWGDYSLSYVIALVSGLSQDVFKVVYEEADRLASETRARKAAQSA